MKTTARSFVGVIFFITLFLFIFINTPNRAEALLINEGGPILSYIYPLPCINLPPPAFATLKLSYNIGVIPVIYPYIPIAITKSNFIPAVPGLTELGKAAPVGVCVVLIPCPIGLCPFPIPGFLSTLHGNAFQ